MLPTLTPSAIYAAAPSYFIDISTRARRASVMPRVMRVRRRAMLRAARRACAMTCAVRSDVYRLISPSPPCQRLPFCRLRCHDAAHADAADHRLVCQRAACHY